MSYVALASGAVAGSLHGLRLVEETDLGIIRQVRTSRFAHQACVSGFMLAAANEKDGPRASSHACGDATIRCLSRPTGTVESLLGGVPMPAVYYRVNGPHTFETGSGSCGPSAPHSGGLRPPTVWAFGPSGSPCCSTEFRPPESPGRRRLLEGEALHSQALQQQRSSSLPLRVRCGSRAGDEAVAAPE